MARLGYIVSLLAIVAVSVWGSALLALLATFVPSMAGVLASAGQTFVVGVAVVLLFMGTQHWRPGARPGARLLAIHPQTPGWAWLVEILLVLLVLLFWILAPAGRDNNGVCVSTVGFDSVELSPAACAAMRLAHLRIVTALVLAYGWLPVVALSLQKRGQRR